VSSNFEKKHNIANRQMKEHAYYFAKNTRAELQKYSIPILRHMELRKWGLE